MIYKQEEVARSKLKIENKIFSAFKDLEKQSSFFNYGGKIVRTCPADLIRAVSEIPVDNKLELTIKNIYVNWLLNAEKKCLGSAVVCLKMILNPEVNFETGFFRSTVEDAKKVALNYISNDGYSFKLATAALDLGGVGSNVFFKTSRDKDFFVFAHSGRSIVAKKSEIFNSQISRLQNARIIFIDGVVESVGEIDCLLNSAASSKENVAIFSRGYSPDVVQTLHKNFTEKRLNVFPFEYPAVDSESILDFCNENKIPLFTPMTSNDLRTAVVEDLKTKEFINYSSGVCTISDSEGKDCYIEISIPERLKSVRGIIEDRVLFTKKIIECCFRDGVSSVLIENKEEKFSNISIKAAKKINKNFLETIKNLHIVIAG